MGQVFCRMSLSWDLFCVYSRIDWGDGFLGGRLRKWSTVFLTSRQDRYYQEDLTIVGGDFDHQADVTSVETSYFMPLDLFPYWTLLKEVKMHYRPPTLKGGVGEADGPSPRGQSIYINNLGFFCAKDFVSFSHLFMSVWTHGYLFYCLSSSSFGHLGFCFSFSWIVCLLIFEFEEILL